MAGLGVITGGMEEEGGHTESVLCENIVIFVTGGFTVVYQLLCHLHNDS